VSVRRSGEIQKFSPRFRREGDSQALTFAIPIKLDPNVRLDVFSSIPQSRQRKFPMVNPGQQIFTKPPVPDRSLEVGIRSGDKLEVTAYFPVAAERPKRFFFDGAQLYKKKDARRHLAGNRLRIIGYGESEETRGLNEITTRPGTAINLINGKVRSDFSFFIHAPFKQDVDSDVCPRNNTSIVLQARFKIRAVEWACLALFGGDAHWDVWRAILNRSEGESLEWDLLLAPHHCSWSFFNDTPYEDHREPQKSSLDVLGHHRDGAFVIASSKPIKDDHDNPPHYAAAEEYKKSVGTDHFFCTGEWPCAEKPEPLIFRMTEYGPVKDESSTTSRVRSAAAVGATLRSPNIYG